MGHGGASQDSEVGDVCVVSLRAKPTNHNATHELLDILAAISPVVLIASNLIEDAALREEHEVIDVDSGSSGYSASTMAIRFILLQFRLCRAIAAREEEIVVFFGITAYVVPVVFSRLLGKTVIVEPRGDVPLTLRLRWSETMPDPVAISLAGAVRVLERLTYTVASAIITYTPAMADELGLDRYVEKLYTRGARHVEIDRFTPFSPFEARKEIVGYLGRFDVEKGVETLTQVAARMPTGVCFVFVGDGFHRDSMEARLSEEVAAGRVEFTGWIDHDEVPTQLNRFRLLIMPSEPTEGLPTTILEAFACGTPVYAKPVSGIPDIVLDGETGFHMTEDDPDAVVDRIEEILGREDLPEISDSARRFVVDKYNFQATVGRYRKMLTEITQARTP